MTDNSRKVLTFLQEAGQDVKFTVKEVQKALGFEKAGSVTGSISGLTRKKMAEWITEETVNDEGKTVEVKYFKLTPAGMSYNPDAE